MNIFKDQIELKNTFSILLIEDNPADARLLEIQLNSIEQANYTIKHAACMSDALALLKQENFDVVLTDLSLPDADGFESIETLIEFDPQLPIVVMSGQEDEEFTIKAVQLGAQDYLIKGIGDGHLMSRAIRYAVERKRAEKNMQYLAHYDSLTGLANRVLFRERLEYGIARAQRNNSQLALLFIDLDRFKQINDTLGHNAGDELLVNVSGRIQSCTRKEDTVARLGGDEFVVILENIKSVKDVSYVANKIINALSKSDNIAGQELYITPSIGITIFPDDNTDANELIKYADAAMYQAKEKGRNRYQFFTDNMNNQSRYSLNVENKLRSALENDEFILHYQPKFDINNKTITGAEALIRWLHPELGMVPPLDFIPIAEDTGLIIPIGEWVIRESCRNLQEWKSLGYNPIRVAVNLSPRQFRDSQIIDYILDTMVEFDIKPNEFEVEITESLLMEDTDATILSLNKLKAWGLHIAIDDFGTGYCSLGYLKKFPIDTLKIDRSFVKDILVEPDDAAITEAIIAMGHSLRISLTAEGIETEDQLRFLKQHGCQEGQGYLFSKPIEASELLEFMQLKTVPEDKPVPIKRSA